MLQSTLLTGILSLRLRRRSVGEEARVSFPKLFLLLSCFTFSMIAPPNLFQNRSESCSDYIQGSLAVAGYSNSYTRAMGVQESHGVDEHLALKECLVGLNIARVVGFHQLYFFSCIILWKRLLKERSFGKQVSKIEWKRFYKVKFFLRLQSEENFWRGLKSMQVLKTKCSEGFVIKDFKSRDFKILLFYYYYFL